MNRKDFDSVFSPQSIALVGLPREFKSGKVFLMGLLDQKFPGPIYPIHPTAPEIDGLTAYKSLLDVPGPIDLVIILSPKETVFKVLDECARKQVKSVVLFTSGFSELGAAEGRQAERRMGQIAREGGFRLIGPNCMGVYSPISHLSSFPGLSSTPGALGLISQSGSLMNLIVSSCSQNQIFFSYAVSYGNSADAGLPEFLEWMAQDRSTRLICSYCEGLENPRELIPALKASVSRKPLIMWKAGLTRAGSRAAASHTGSMTGVGTLWKSLFRQFRVLDVYDIEELVDLVKAFYHLEPHGAAGRIAIISAPGGPAVAASDAVERNGLSMAALGKKSLERLRALLPPAGASPSNPVDLGLGAAFAPRLYLESLEICLEDPEVDTVLMVGGGRTPEAAESFTQGLVSIRKKTSKHIMAFMYPGASYFSPEHISTLLSNGIPVYSTPERGLRAYSRMLEYHRFRAEE